MSAIESLRAQIRGYENHNAIIQDALPFGVADMDDCLPGGGLAQSAFHEVAGGGNGAIHAAAATLFVAGILARTQGPVLWCLKQRDLFAPALTEVGLTLDRILFVEAPTDKSLLACFEEGLRQSGICAVVGEIHKLSLVASRRLQLAAETGGAMGIAIRRWHKVADTDQWSATTAPHALANHGTSLPAFAGSGNLSGTMAAGIAPLPIWRKRTIYSRGM